MKRYGAENETVTRRMQALQRERGREGEEGGREGGWDVHITCTNVLQTCILWISDGPLLVKTRKKRRRRRKKRRRRRRRRRRRGRRGRRRRKRRRKRRAKENKPRPVSD